MRDFAEAEILGNLTAPPEIIEVNEAKVANFKVAVNRKWRDSAGELRDKVSFISIVAWNRHADYAAKYLTKGSSVYIKGKIDEDRWEKDGHKRSKVQVVVEEINRIWRPGRKDEESESALAVGTSDNAKEKSSAVRTREK